MDLKAIEDVIGILQKYGVHEIEVEEGEMRVRVTAS